MAKICYVEKRFNDAHSAVIDHVNTIIDEYQEQGFDLTLRQVYYQMVSRGLIPNKDTEYKRLGGIIADARLAGLVDWEAITDRTRNLRSHSHWDDPGDIISSAASSYRVDKWSNQEYRPEVWVEKDALVGVIGHACDPLDVPYFSCRGYTSLSELWSAAQRMIRHRRTNQIPIVFHLGDHDPSGIDMSRDIQDRLRVFNCEIQFRRLALNMDQVRQYDPPPNPAKVTDSRFTDYEAAYGDESWELDALEPTVLVGLIEAAVEEVRDQEQWTQDQDRETREREQLTDAAERWQDVVEYLEGIA